MNITICGGGNLGHVLLGVLSASGEHRLNLLTQHPSLWSKQIVVEDSDNRIFTGAISCITDRAEIAIPQSEMVILCLPGVAIEKTLLQIRPFLSPGCKVGSVVASTGFFYIAKDILPAAELFGFQRVPFISRVVEYGRRANLLGYKKKLLLATENMPYRENFRATIETMLSTPTDLLGSHWEASLSNSNPLLHTARLYSMWNNWNETVAYDHQTLFYHEWDDEASELLIAMDSEFMRLLSKLPVDPKRIPPILEYYESTDAASLTKKIRSIEAFKTITSPMRQTSAGWIPDFGSRYFTEDFPFGLKFVKQEIDNNNIRAPHINKVFEWGMSKISNV